MRDHYARTGALPGELIDFIQTEVARRGRIITRGDASRMFLDHLDAWAEVFLREADNRSASERRTELRRRAQVRGRLRAAQHVTRKEA